MDAHMDAPKSEGYEYEGYTNIAIQLYVIYIQYLYYRLAVVQYFILYNNELIKVDNLSHFIVSIDWMPFICRICLISY